MFFSRNTTIVVAAIIVAAIVVAAIVDGGLYRDRLQLAPRELPEVVKPKLNPHAGLEIFEAGGFN